MKRRRDPQAAGGARLVAYYRVSTQQQGRSGLGLEAQRKLVGTYAASHGLTIAAEFTEVETGKGADALDRRPVFAEAMRQAKKLGAPIVVAKLDRLSRDVAFISGLMAKKVDFVTADDPTKSPFLLHIKAAVAEEERRMISQRTREALAAAKERGVRLGNPDMERIRGMAAAAKRAGAREFAARVMPAIGEIQRRGIVSRRGIATELDRLKIPTVTGAPWSGTMVGLVLSRAMAVRSMLAGTKNPHIDQVVTTTG